MTSAIEREHFFAERSRQAQRRIEAGDSSRGLAFFAKAFAVYQSDARKEILLEEAQELGELLDLRFVGPQAESGNLPLHQFLEILTPLNKSLNCAAYRLRYGQEQARVDDATRSVIDLRMAGTAVGSSRILVLGSKTVDMTGVSLLDATLAQTFRVLTSPAEEFYDAVDAIGGTSAKALGEALERTEKHGLAVDFNWDRKFDPMTWNGTPREMQRVISLINSTQEPETVEEEIYGSVATLNDSGAISLRIGDSKVRVRFPLNLIEEVERLSLGDDVILRVQTARFFDAIKKVDVLKHTLIEVLSVT